jgi:hypothetical protein
MRAASAPPYQLRRRRFAHGTSLLYPAIHIFIYRRAGLYVYARLFRLFGAGCRGHLFSVCEIILMIQVVI